MKPFDSIHLPRLPQKFSKPVTDITIKVTVPEEEETYNYNNTYDYDYATIVTGTEDGDGDSGILSLVNSCEDLNCQSNNKQGFLHVPSRTRTISNSTTISSYSETSFNQEDEEDGYSYILYSQPTISNNAENELKTATKKQNWLKKLFSKKSQKTLAPSLPQAPKNFDTISLDLILDDDLLKEEMKLFDDFCDETNKRMRRRSLDVKLQNSKVFSRRRIVDKISK